VVTTRATELAPAFGERFIAAIASRRHWIRDVREVSAGRKAPQ
jgi:hypothetical protein